jgi:hypothetical protein
LNAGYPGARRIAGTANLYFVQVRDYIYENGATSSLRVKQNKMIALNLSARSDHMLGA